MLPIYLLSSEQYEKNLQYQISSGGVVIGKRPIMSIAIHSSGLVTVTRCIRNFFYSRSCFSTRFEWLTHTSVLVIWHTRPVLFTFSQLHSLFSWNEVRLLCNWHMISLLTYLGFCCHFPTICKVWNYKCTSSFFFYPTVE